jgi:hypothetical protein
MDWAQVSRFYPKMETEASLRNVVLWKINRTVFLDNDRMMDNVQKHNICPIYPSIASRLFKYIDLHFAQHFNSERSFVKLFFL